MTGKSEIHEDRFALASDADIGEIAEQLGIVDALRRAGRELTGPCPVCGGNDRFSINTEKGVFNCRICGGRGGVVRLVQFVEDCNAREAVAFIVGEIDQARDPEAWNARREEWKSRQKARDEIAEKRRAAVVRMAARQWSDAQQFQGSLAFSYLKARGITFTAKTGALRCNPSAEYMIKHEGQWLTLHEGPCMVALIERLKHGADGRPTYEATGIHRTWFDPMNDRFKLSLTDPNTGEPVDRKKTLGSKKGGFIRLVNGTSGRIIMGEGIETTMSAWQSQADPQAHYWCGVDLGNMAGRQRKVPGVRNSGQPDMTDERAFIPPEWCNHLTFLMDSDSDPASTRAKLLSGLRRARRLKPSIIIDLVGPNEGDLNDVLQSDDLSAV